METHLEADKGLLPTYRTRIGRAKAYPAACPVCGGSTELKAGDPPALPVAFGDMLRRAYSEIWHLERRQLDPPWENYHTWDFVCDHVDPMTRAVYSDSFMLQRVKKCDDFQGKSFNVPFEYSK